MGHFHNPPPGPIAGATAAQPYGCPKLPPAITAVTVNNPPFADPSRTLAVIAENAALAQPDPWVYAFQEGNGGQPYGSGRLPPAIEAVPVNNPPFSHGGRLAWAAEIAAIVQPDPWVYSIQPNTGFQPYGRGKLTPPSVDNPPQLRYRIDRIADVISRSWQPPDPLPILIGKLSPGIPGQSVDNPPRFLRRVDPYPLADPPLQPQARYVPQVAVAVATQNPFFNAWLATVLQSWRPGDPPIQLPRNLNPFFTAVQVDNPPFSSRTQIPGIVLSWLPPDPLPTLIGKLSPGIPGQSVDNPPQFRFLQNPYPSDVPSIPQRTVYLPQAAAAAAAQNPFFNAWLSGVLASWQPGDPIPTLPRNLNPFFTAVQVDNPPFSSRTQIPGIVLSWLPPDPSPILQGKLSPGIPGQSVDNPPGLLVRQFPYPPDAFVLPQQLVLIPQAAAAAVVQNPFVLSWLAGVLQSWQPGDPPVTLPRNLCPFFLGVQVDNPPFSYGGRNVWSADLIVRGWQPPDPQPTLSGKLPPFITAVPVNNPPFSGFGRSELANILGQWAAFPPLPLPSPSKPPPQVQPGPPPPVVTAQFTVSGPDISVYLTEFFTDVVYTDAPITKRTV